MTPIHIVSKECKGFNATPVTTAYPTFSGEHMYMTRLLFPYTQPMVAQLSSGRLYASWQASLPEAQVAVWHVGSSSRRYIPPFRNGQGAVLETDVGPQFTLERSYQSISLSYSVVMEYSSCVMAPEPSSAVPSFIVAPSGAAGR